MRVNRDLAGQIIFEFSQDAVAAAGVEGEKNLAALATMGFALSMDHVDNLRLDFLRLKAIGFRHLKIRATAMTAGHDGAGAHVAAEDFKKLLTRHGLNLIAERVEDEKTVVQLLDYAVDYAQGYLFGEPRAVREEQIKAVSPGSRAGHSSQTGQLAHFAALTGTRPQNTFPVMSLPRLISGLSEIAPHHDALICDVWGVVHDGQRHHPAAADALYRFKERHGPVVLLTNAPRVPAEVAAQCASYGLPPDCYDAIVVLGRRGAGRTGAAERRPYACHFIISVPTATCR